MMHLTFILYFFFYFFGVKTVNIICLQETILKLISDKINVCQDSKGFLIDGYPRELEQGIEFEQKVLYHFWFQLAMTSQ